MTQTKKWDELRRALVARGWSVTAEGALASPTGGIVVTRDQLEDPARLWLFASVKRRMISSRKYCESAAAADLRGFEVALDETCQLWDELVALNGVPDLSAVAPDLTE